MRWSPAFLAAVVLTAWGQTCQVCGEVRGIREINLGSSEAEARTPAAVGTASGLDTPPVVGTVAEFRFDRGRAEGWSFGAAGTPEMQTRLGQTTYEITVAMDIGERRVLRRSDGNRFRVGQRVALRGGELEPM